ncbi:uncharacterized protein BDR25DRAFT_372378 [Lindgomyces ingoldianus]|uniref:Uncharacterized protein n=1 Tax=Lindgomyces ingoldianus TaxID=673940 RepID=A0ACB6QRM9_9PLEO|nr:uncharacterized protein BDR25DRAFT_372378 [Lindgomyces ingoldianus]KAF2469180.1 hypothetical protein BDR25DRAFT_372378 [Lindgomyces ingoldianus]
MVYLLMVAITGSPGCILSMYDLNSSLGLGRPCCHLTHALWPSSVWRHSPLLASQILTVLSPDPAPAGSSCERRL